MKFFLYIVLSCIGAYIIISLILSIAAVKILYKRRYEGNKNLKYFQVTDFADLSLKKCTFRSDKGQILQGYLYDSAKKSCNKGIIVFVHGLGTGHLAYTTEINTFVQAGFQVFTYDATGCGASEGKNIKGFDQGPIDLKYALRYIRLNVASKGKKLYLIGHSWGAFTVMNILDKEFGVTAAVAMSGFISASAIVAQNLGKVFTVFYPLIVFFQFIYNFCIFGKEANRNAVRSVKSSKCPLYLIYGKKDRTVNYKKNALRLKNIFTHDKRILFLECENKGHNVYLTEDAERYMARIFREITKVKKARGNSITALYQELDYKRITNEDCAVMNSIIHFFEGNTRS